MEKEYGREFSKREYSRDQTCLESKYSTRLLLD